MLKCWVSSEVTTAQVSRSSQVGDRGGGGGGGGECAAGRGKHFPNVHGRVEQGMSLEHSLKWLFFKLKKIFLSFSFSPFYLISCFRENPIFLPLPSLFLAPMEGMEGILSKR